MPRTKAQNTRSTRERLALSLVESLAICGGFQVSGNDKSGIDDFLEDVRKGKIMIELVKK